MTLNISNLVICPKEAEDDIKKEIEGIRKLILESDLIELIDIIFLGGGFGRGEGSVIYKEKKYTTSNDYDIIMLCQNSINKDMVNKLACMIEKKLNLKFFGIEVICESKFTEIMESNKIPQSYFDLFFGNKILWINENYTKWNQMISLMNSRQYTVQIKSAFEVLKTRLWCMVALANDNGNLLYDRDYVKDYNFFFFQQVKLATAIIDAILISEEKYKSPKFVDKLLIFQKTEFYQMHDCNIICELVKIKLYNKEIIKLNINDIKDLNDIYIKAVNAIIHNHRIKHWIYYLQARVRNGLYMLFRHKFVRTWYLEDYKCVELGNDKKIKMLKDRMRGMYE